MSLLYSARSRHDDGVFGDFQGLLLCRPVHLTADEVVKRRGPSENRSRAQHGSCPHQRAFINAAVAAYQNIVFLPTIFVSGVFYDVHTAPTFLRDIARVLPLVHVIDGLSGALVTGRGLGDNLSALAVIGAWSAFGIVFAIRGFSWESRRA